MSDSFTTSGGYVVDVPDDDGEVEIDASDSNQLWFKKSDLEGMLALFDSPTTPTEGEV